MGGGVGAGFPRGASPSHRLIRSVGYEAMLLLDRRALDRRAAEPDRGKHFGFESSHPRLKADRTRDRPQASVFAGV